jgi:hypothetical protein
MILNVVQRFATPLCNELLTKKDEYPLRRCFVQGDMKENGACLSAALRIPVISVRTAF